MKSAISVLCFIEGALCLMEPSYISNWTYIEAHNETHCEVTFNHSLGERPVKVDVQVMAIDGPNEGFIFTGIGSAPTGAIANQNIGGVVYIYNEEQVVVMAPNTPDGTASVINTGKGVLLPDGSEDHQTSIRAKVRVRVWAASDFPPPRKGTYFGMDVNDEAKTYYKMENATTELEERVVVSVQVKIKDGNLTGWFCDAQGSPSVDDRSGGVRYKRNVEEHYIEIWAPSARVQDDYGDRATLCSTMGGWGSSEGRSGFEATVFVKVWSYLSSHYHPLDFLSAVNRSEYLTRAFDLDNHILTPWVLILEAVTGTNKSSTEVSTIAWEPFGNSFVISGVKDAGPVVYAYSGSTVRVWFAEAYRYYKVSEDLSSAPNYIYSREMHILVGHDVLSEGCSEVKDAENAVRISPPGTEPYSVGSEVVFICDTGYKHVGGRLVRSCSHFGTWGCSPKCEIVTCPEPDQGLNSTFSPASDEYQYKMTVTYTCLNGYYSSGDKMEVERTCTDSGVWTGSPMDCRVITCPNPDLGQHSSFYPASAEYQLNTTVTYSCLTGYQTSSGEVARICKESGEWTGSPLDCTVVTCPNPEPGQKSTFSPASVEYKYNMTVTYSCLSGYQSTGGHVTRTCDESGSWTGSPLNCTVTTCPIPEKGQNSVFSPVSVVYKYNMTVTYHCLDGYQVTGGDSERTCHEYGGWSGSPLDCTEDNETARCPKPEPGQNSTFSPASEEYKYNMTVTYSCLAGYQATGGHVTRTCDESGSWTGSPLNCTMIVCQAPDQGQHSMFSPASVQYQYNITVKYSCLAGYQSNRGDPERTCNEYGGWTGSSLDCTAVNCYCGCDMLSKYYSHMDFRTQQGNKSLAAMVKEIQERIHVPKWRTSYFRRKLVSVPDDRPVATSVGYIAVTSLCTLIGGIVLADIVYLGKYFAALKFCQRFNRQRRVPMAEF